MVPRKKAIIEARDGTEGSKGKVTGILNPQSSLREERMDEIAKMFLLATANFSEVNYFVEGS